MFANKNIQGKIECTDIVSLLTTNIAERADGSKTVKFQIRTTGLDDIIVEITVNSLKTSGVTFFEKVAINPENNCKI